MNRLVASDLANIEGRALAWLAGEEWKLDAFRAFDRGDGPDLYRVAYARAYGIEAADVTGDQRQIGKVMELALGYQGGKHAFASMATNYGISVVEFREEAPADAQFVLTFADAEEIKNQWRAAHPATVAFWYGLDRAAKSAVDEPGKITKCGPIAYRVMGDFLYCRLPSGRSIAYPYPSIIPPDADDTDDKPAETGADKPAFKRTWPQLGYWGVDSRPGKSKAWCQQRAYGGLLAENVTQAVARDVLMLAFKRIENAGYRIVMHIHDEVVCEAARGHGSPEHLSALLTQGETWTAGLPLASKGWDGARYKKD